MPYTPTRKVYDLEVDGHPDLTVRARSISMGQVLELSESLEARIFGPVIGPENLPHLAKVMAALGSALVDWDLVDEHGAPVPATEAGLRTLDHDLFKAVALAWVDAITAVPRPLEPPSPSGEPSPEASIPMDVPSPSPGSSPTPS